MADPNKVKKAAKKIARSIQLEQRMPTRQVTARVNAEVYERLLSLIERGSFSRTLDQLLAALVEELESDS